MSSSGHERLVVRWPSARRNGPRKRLSKALSKAHRNLKELKTENSKLRRKVKTVQRRMQRMMKKDKTLTPRSKTEKMLRSAGIRKGEADSVRRQLLMSNVIFAEMTDKVKVKNRKVKRCIYGAVVGKLLVKYRCMSRLCKSAKLNRNLVSSVIKKGVDLAKGRRRIQFKYKESVISFLEREDNCRVQPGKKDAVKSEGEKIQTRVLTDYIDNLYEKYRSENPDAKLSLATFKRIRPKHILTTTFLSRNTCLCTKHQNFAFKLKMFKSEGILTTSNPDDFVRQNMIVEKNQLPEKVVYSVWKRVTVKDGKKKMKIVKEEMGREEFYKVWENDVAEFKGHVSRIQKQYNEIRQLKQELPEQEVILHMDFAENYSCKTADEIQSAYWNQSQVTLHPIVLYFKDPGTLELKHRSFVAVSDCLTHASSTVLSILDTFYDLQIPELRNINHVHYWTDSPTSQYRNRYIFDALMNHEAKYGCTATWNYFEAGHGKGPCDGVGGTVKRMADEAVNSQKTTIQDAEDFFSWAKKSSVKGVYFFFVTKDDCDRKAEDVKKCTLQPVKGTMLLHACRTGTDNNLLLTGKTSCYCKDCIQKKTCENWCVIAVSRTPVAKTPSNIEAGRDDQSITNEETSNTPLAKTPCSVETRCDALKKGGQSSGSKAAQGSVSCKSDGNKGAQIVNLPNTAVETGSELYVVDDFVAAVYLDDWYIGKIIQIDHSDNEVEINFMTKKKNLFQWPPENEKDIIWVEHCKVLCKINPPLPSGKSGRMHRMDVSDRNKVENCYQVFISK